MKIAKSRVVRGFTRLALIGVCSATCAYTRLASAQDAGTVHGTVVDSSGAILPGAAVTAIQIKTGARRTTKTNGAGQYSLPQLAPGEYEITTEKDGFSKLVRSGLNLTTGQDAVLDLSLTVGGAAETVNVAAGAELIDTAGSSLSTVIQGRQVVDMPLNGRNVLNLVTLVPGVIPQGSSGGNPLGQPETEVRCPSPEESAIIRLGGGFAGQSVIYIDGAPNNMLLQNNYCQHRPDPGFSPGVPGRNEQCKRAVRWVQRGCGQHDHQVRAERLPRNGVRVHS